MSFQKFWRDYKVLVVMIPLVGLIHLGWHRIKSSPVFQIPNKDDLPEPDSLAPTSPEKNHIPGE
ncbi:uncharacterized LOC128706665 homolog [Balaenoptera ricei]|uniref:Uncharacterized LOC128706665 homolog n=1 Tax=Balaenoptera acutorostrata TaxID=9767 RepID=A0ABM3S7B1_BALAC|nr:uncharacterized LOC128706665 homolog [Balaenoptera acutorostrata]XP_057385742.1 uncharacterized LOC128706665 homolog [Balaenoptera acutorostrata]XP_059752083.1 uncharacterized LOC128706665 homolog [Balaenoptera ricei]XP_059752084.1 uncharacterized LOC128706665 homolog [Balaenoptera ricei]